MDLLKVIIFGVGCIVLGIVGGFVAKSLLAGIVLGLFVFIGWVLWRLFKLQNPDSQEISSEEETEK